MISANIKPTIMFNLCSTSTPFIPSLMGALVLPFGTNPASYHSETFGHKNFRERGGYWVMTNRAIKTKRQSFMRFRAIQIPLTSCSCSHQEQGVNLPPHLHKRLQRFFVKNSHQTLWMHGITNIYYNYKPIINNDGYMNNFDCIAKLLLLEKITSDVACNISCYTEDWHSMGCLLNQKKKHLEIINKRN